jgi:hypothetical protein
VGALGHFLEREGIPTTGISLVREHTETVRPPRALWVTFELGRPLGVPDDAGFQRRVLKAALDLLARTDGPIIADYPEDVPEVADLTGWACPISLPPAASHALLDEVAGLAAWHDLAVRNHGRTTVGLSGLDMPSAARLVLDAAGGTLPEAGLLKRATDDLKAYYLEAASAFPAPGRHGERKTWLWGETALGRALLDLQPKLAASADPKLKLLGTLTLIPATERHRLAPPA